DVAVLCPIALDHPELGSTVAEVAAEKAGIIKPGRIAVAREQPEEALRIVKSRCAEVGTTLLLEGADWGLAGRMQGVGGQMLSVRGVHGTYREIRIPLFGDHAARNAAAAIVSAECFLGRALRQEVVAGALADARSPGRAEVMDGPPRVVL